MALKNDGTVVAWSGSTVPADLRGVTAMAAGGGHALAILGQLASPPALVQPGFSNGQFHVQLQGDTNRVWLVQASTNLVNWTVLSTVTNVSGSVLIQDNEAGTHARRFYRAVMP